MGICYLGDYLPRDISEIKALQGLLNLLNISGYKGKVVFVNSDMTKQAQGILSKYTNLNIAYYLYSEDSVTDITINQYVFSSILLHNRDFYHLKEEPAAKVLTSYTPSLKYETLMPLNYVLALYPVIVRQTPQDTLKFDTIISNLGGDIIAMHIRKSFILAHHGILDINSLDKASKEIIDVKHSTQINVISSLIKERAKEHDNK